MRGECERVPLLQLIRALARGLWEGRMLKRRIFLRASAPTSIWKIDRAATLTTACSKVRDFLCGLALARDLSVKLFVSVMNLMTLKANEQQ